MRGAISRNTSASRQAKSQARRQSSPPAEIGDAPLPTMMPPQLTLAHHLGHFCCFYVNDAPRTPQLWFPSLRPHEKDLLITRLLLAAFCPVSLFPYIMGKIEFVFTLESGPKTLFPILMQSMKQQSYSGAPVQEGREKTESRGGNTSHG